MADYPLGSLGLQIDAHWKQHRPKMYAELEKSGHLAESLHAAQEQTSDLIGSLLGQGLSRDQAWELRGRSGRPQAERIFARQFAGLDHLADPSPHCRCFHHASNAHLTAEDEYKTRASDLRPLRRGKPRANLLRRLLKAPPGRARRRHCLLDPRAMTGRGRVLVDDEPEVLNMLREIVEHLGHEASTALSGEEAIAAIATVRYRREGAERSMSRF